MVLQVAAEGDAVAVVTDEHVLKPSNDGGATTWTVAIEEEGWSSGGYARFSSAFAAALFDGEVIVGASMGRVWHGGSIEEDGADYTLELASSTTTTATATWTPTTSPTS